MPKVALPKIDTEDAPEIHYKDFNDEKADRTGFYYKPFRGDYVKAKCDITDYDGKHHMLDSYPLFVITSPSDKQEKFESNQSGTLGLGPSVGDNSELAKYNFVRQLRGSA